jgi:hypothetical protein
MKVKFETASLSTINYDCFQRFLDFTKLSIKPVLFRGQYPKQDIDPYKWNTLAENYKAKCKET